LRCKQWNLDHRGSNMALDEEISNWFNRNLSGLSGWVVIIAVIISSYIVTTSQGVAEHEVGEHVRVEVGAHPTLETRLSYIESEQKVIKNDIAHIKTTVDALNDNTVSNKGVLDAILVEVQKE